MKASEGPFRSPLDKPLKELTEEDISQLTREDCRRYLKEKGMRRPSWNKSQAIQQVLSLKALFESWPGKEETGSRKSQPAASGGACPAERAGEEPVNLSEGSPSGSGAEEGRSVPPDLESPVAAPEPSTIHLPVFCPRGEDVDVARSGVAGDTGFLQASREPAGDFPMFISRDSESQMTIFYGGKVDVYDDVPAEKARAVLLLAASPNFMPHLPDSRSFAFTTRRARPPSPPPPQGAAPPPPSSSSPSANDGPKTRKESVQRFLEKRKDRGRLKPVWGRLKSSSPMEFYLNHHMRESSRNVRTSSADTCSPTNPIPPPTPRRSGTGQPISTGDPNEDENRDAAR